MKKLILSIAILAVMTFAACSEEEKDYTPNYLGCMHCDIPDEEGYEVCVDESGNAFVGNADTGIALDQYFNLFCDNEPEVPGTPLVFTECATCISEEDPEGTKICRGPNGNAYVFTSNNNSTDSGIPMAEYIAANCDSTEPIEEEPVQLTNCVDCMAAGVAMPDVCKGPNGHAYLDGTDTGMAYSLYIDSIEAAGGSCD